MAESLLIALKEKDRSMREQGISLVISSFSSEIFEKTIAYKKQKEEDRSMREQGISLIMSSFSSEIEDYSI